MFIRSTGRRHRTFEAAPSFDHSRSYFSFDILIRSFIRPFGQAPAFRFAGGLSDSCRLLVGVQEIVEFLNQFGKLRTIFLFDDLLTKGLHAFLFVSGHWGLACKGFALRIDESIEKGVRR